MLQVVMVCTCCLLSTPDTLVSVPQWEVTDFSKIAEKHYSPKFEIGTHLW